MKKYELDAEQEQMLERAFLMVPPQDGVTQKLESINEKIQQAAKYLMTITKKCPEQAQMLRKLQEASMWAQEAVKKTEF